MQIQEEKIKETLKNILKLNHLKENQIKIFIKNFEKIEESQISSILEFKKILSKEKEFKHKKIENNFMIENIFRILMQYYPEYKIIKKFWIQWLDLIKNSDFYKEIQKLKNFFRKLITHLG